MKHLFCFCMALICIFGQAHACTTAVISGKYAPGGRSMLWKVRDTESLHNKMMYFDDSKYAFIGLVNTEDSKGSQVWAGSNEVGFAIMNSASFNVNLNDSSAIKDQEGFFMKKALGECATLADFEALLAKTPKPMGLAAHFGVIDAQGGAAFYEVNNRTFVKFDANDPLTAPKGVVLRTNFSFTGEKDQGLGYCRFQTAQELLAEGCADGKLTPRTFMQDYSRSFKNSFLQIDYREQYQSLPAGQPRLINMNDLITRHETSSAILIEGVKDRESKDMNTIWVQVGYPETCATFPLWVRAGKELPSILTTDSENKVALSDWATHWKERCFPIKTVEKERYLSINNLLNASGKGYLQRIEQVEEEIFDEVGQAQRNWEKKTPSVKELQAIYQNLSRKICSLYTND